MALASDGTVTAFLYTADIDRCLEWYGKVIGLEAHGRDDYGAFLRSGSALVRVTAMPDFKPGEHPALGWDVPDIRTAAEELRGKGVTFTVYDGMGQDELGIWSSPDGQTKLAWFADPDGNVLSLSENGQRG